MALTVLTPASTRRLTTLQAVWDELGTDDIGLDAMIDRVSAAIERYCGRIFALQQYRETVYGFHGPTLQLQATPLVSVTPVLIGETAITDYSIYRAESGLLWRDHQWWGLSTWSVYASSAWGFPTAPIVTADYYAGFVLPEQVSPVVAGAQPLPGDIEQAAIEGIKVWHHERNPSGTGRIASRQIGDQRVSYAVSASNRGLPPMSQMILRDSGWRRWVIR